MKKSLLIFGIFVLFLFPGAQQSNNNKSVEVKYCKTFSKEGYQAFSVLKFNSNKLIQLDTNLRAESKLHNYGRMLSLEEGLGSDLFYSTEKGVTICINHNKNEWNKSLKKYPVITKLHKEYKNILGYRCRKATITQYSENGDVIETFAWFTNKIGNKSINQFTKFHDIYGLVLQDSCEYYNCIALQVVFKEFTENDFKAPQIFYKE